MTDLTPVDVKAPGLQPAGDRPVVFHGVNKSGSLAMSDVLRSAYIAANRGSQFCSVYHDSPPNLDQLATAMQAVSGHAFFVSHYIYRNISLPPDSLLVSQIRHPLPRTLSVYGWRRGKHLREHGTHAGFPSLEEWVVQTLKKRQTQIAQFAVGYPSDMDSQILRRSADELCSMALHNLHTDFTWFGCADLFEESVVTMAHICGLDAVPLWKRDTRNIWRQSTAETNPDTIDLIYDTFAAEFRFYDQALATLKSRLSDIRFGPSLDSYRAQCSNQYKERLSRP